jgi:hypothetical protein
MSEHHIGISVTAKAGMDPESYAPQLERRWAQERDARLSPSPVRQ